MKEYICENCGAKYEQITTGTLARPQDRAPSCQYRLHPIRPHADEHGFMLQYLPLERPGATEPITDAC
jgi:DNA-directed RNA polymerase subunit RPC12/RpoP